MTHPRHVTDATPGPYDGDNYPTHLVTLWLENDQPLYWAACRLAERDRNGQHGRRLEEMVRALLYPSPQPRRTLPPYDAHAAHIVREGLQPGQFEDIDWDAVRASLLMVT